MEISEKKRTMTFLLFLLSCFVSSFLATALATALPEIIRDLQVDAGTGQWMTSGYGIAMGISILFTSFFLNHFSVKKVFLFSMLSFILGAGLSGFAHSFFVMMLGRVLQAWGNGLINTMAQVVILSMYPKEKRGFIMGWYGVSIGVAPVVAPVLTGCVVDTFGWQWVFYGVAIVMGIAFLGACFLVESDLKIGQDSLFLDIHVVKEKTFLYGVLGSCLVFFVMMGASVLMPLFVQETLGCKATVSGFVALPGAILLAVVSPIAGKIYDRVGIQKIFIVGSLLLFLGNIFMSFVSMGTPLWLVAAYHGIRSIAFGLLIMPLVTWGNSALGKRQVSSGTSMINAARTFAGSAGAALFVWMACTFGESQMKGGGLRGQKIAFAGMTVVAFLLFLQALFCTKKSNDL